MKKISYAFPRSSFLSIDKDINTILDCIVKNQNLLKLLKNTDDTPLEHENIEEDYFWDHMINREVKIVPKVPVDGSVLNYIIISFDNFLPNLTNPYYRDNNIAFDIVCHYDQWQMKGDYAALRPYRIAGELDAMFNGAKLSGIGTLTFLGANPMILNDEFAGISLTYAATHGDDDTKPGAQSSNGRYIPDEDYELPPMDELIIDNFKEMQKK